MKDEPEVRTERELELRPSTYGIIAFVVRW